MKVIHKYQVQAQERFEITMPAGAQIIAVQWQGSHPEGDPMMWVLKDVGAPEIPRSFRLLPTGQEFAVADGVSLQHLGTFQMHNGTFVLHVFEEVEIQ